ncbi:roadblock/LC7 domain-containing protein [Saccharothrix sp. AJ9571]|nr:roadblock/LC7 domain-containing protein [Saccharothrix sp. AJ9571]
MGTGTEFAWDFAEVMLPKVRFLVVASQDGLLTTSRGVVERDDAEKFAAACVGTYALGRNLGELTGSAGAVEQTAYRFPDRTVLIRAAAEGSLLAVVTDVDADLQLLGRAMDRQVRIIGERHLAVPDRAD